MKPLSYIKELTGYLISLALSLIMLLTLPTNAFLEDRLFTMIIFIAFAVIYLLFLSEKGKSIIREYSLRPIVISMTVLILINMAYYLIKSAFSLDFFLRSMLAFLLPSAFLYISKVREKFHGTDIIVLILSLLVVSLQLLNVKLIGYQDTIAFNLGYSFVVLYLLWVFAGYRRIDMGLNFHISLKMLGETVGLAVILITINVILGLQLKFVSFPKVFTFDVINFMLYGIFMLFFATLSEELFFRGLLQNYIQQFSGKYGTAIALAASSVIFGATHLGKFPVAMFLLATIAGVFYGLVYIRTKNLVCAAIIHTMVNLCWKLFFITN